MQVSPTPPLKAPFVWFGGKSRAASLIWERFGDVPNYVEPFAGSLAVLLNRPHSPRIETANDKDGFLVNVWRAIVADPDAVAHYADWPVSELDLTARHAYLVEHREALTRSLEANPEYFDAKLAGWWLWGVNSWIGSGWCTGDGPWRVVDGELVKGQSREGVDGSLPHLGNAGKGVNKQLPKVSRMSGGLGNTVTGSIITPNEGLYEWMQALSERLRRVRITCGDFNRVLTPSVTTKHGLTAVLLDPPYDHEGDKGMYHSYETDVSRRARAWALENGSNPLLRIALCGYIKEHDELLEHGWTAQAWHARKGYQKVSEAGHHTGLDEAILFSPHCIKPYGLFT